MTWRGVGFMATIVPGGRRSPEPNGAGPGGAECESGAGRPRSAARALRGGPEDPRRRSHHVMQAKPAMRSRLHERRNH